MATVKPKRKSGSSARGTAAPEDTRLGLKVGDLLRVESVACQADTSSIEVAQIMMVHRIRYCLVLNKKDELTGIIVARSLQRAAGPRLEQFKAEDVMLPCVTVTADEPIERAAAKMYLNHLQHLVVVSNRSGSNAVLGLIGATDILRHVCARKGGK